MSEKQGVLRENDVETSRHNGSLYVVFLAAVAAVPAMATDMYLAAMPVIAKQWDVPDSRVALSLVLWFVAFSVFLLIYGPQSDKYGRRSMLLMGLALFTGATILAWGGRHYAAFAAGMCLVTFLCGMSRPLSNNLILEQVRTDIGSASSFIVFYQFLVGAICMRAATAPWQTPIRVFGGLALLAPLAVLAIWPLLLRMLRAPAVRGSPQVAPGA